MNMERLVTHKKGPMKSINFTTATQLIIGMEKCFESFRRINYK